MFFLYVFAGLLQGQIEDEKSTGYGFQISESSIPKKAPSGYESIKTVELNTPIIAGNTYEVGFWIFGPQLRDRAYSYPIQVFPSNIIDAVDAAKFKLVESVEIMPTLEVKPQPNYTSRGHYTFIIRPDTSYTQITVALKVNDGEIASNLLEAITVTGIFVNPLPDENSIANSEASEDIDKPEAIVKTKLAERVLIDSDKSYTLTEKELTIGLYDHRNVDKDRVTIYLNDELLVENLELKRKKKLYKATLRPGTNTITLYAENLGQVAPNTAAIMIKTNSQEFMAVLKSDLGSSQFFTLIYNPN